MTSSALLKDDRRGPVIQADTGSAGGQQGTVLAAGLAPVAFSFGHRRVRLLDFGGADLREHNFRETAERWTIENPQLTPVEMGWPEYLAAARETACPPVAGFLFNVARCGSTLLANMLDVLPGSVVLKESGTVTMLLRRLVSASSEAERLDLAELLTVTLPLYGRLTGSAATEGSAGDPAGEPSTPRLFVKPHSSAMVGAETLLELFPDTPAIFLYREPGEVVASMLANAPYGGLYDLPRAQVASGFPSLAGAPADLSPAGFYAHLWRSPVEDALALPPDRVLFLDYAELVNGPVAVIRRTTGHLGIPTTPETVARMAGAMRVYAKDASGQTPFDAAGTHRRPPLDAAQLADVHSVVGDLHNRLEDRRRARA
jgi:hypothetical protein